MNELTEKLVKQAAKKYKSLAKKNDAEFREAIRIEHWNLMVDKLGVDFKKRSMALLNIYRPDFFDNDGYIHEFADMTFNLDHHLSCLAIRVMNRKINRESCLQLHNDWGDLPSKLADPQMRMF